MESYFKQKLIRETLKVAVLIILGVVIFSILRLIPVIKDTLVPGVEIPGIEISVAKILYQFTFIYIAIIVCTFMFNCKKVIETEYNKNGKIFGKIILNINLVIISGIIYAGFNDLVYGLLGSLSWIFDIVVILAFVVPLIMVLVIVFRNIDTIMDSIFRKMLYLVITMKKMNNRNIIATI